MRLIPDSSNGLREYNKCHDPETGEFCSGSGSAVRDENPKYGRGAASTVEEERQKRRRHHLKFAGAKGAAVIKARKAQGIPTLPRYMVRLASAQADREGWTGTLQEWLQAHPDFVTSARKRVSDEAPTYGAGKPAIRGLAKLPAHVREFLPDDLSSLHWTQSEYRDNVKALAGPGGEELYPGVERKVSVNGTTTYQLLVDGYPRRRTLAQALEDYAGNRAARRAERRRAKDA